MITIYVNSKQKDSEQSSQSVIWSVCLVSVSGQRVWSACLVSVSGQRVWSVCLVSVCLVSVCLVSVSGQCVCTELRARLVIIIIIKHWSKINNVQHKDRTITE